MDIHMHLTGTKGQIMTLLEPTTVKLSKRNLKLHTEWVDRVNTENLHVGRVVNVVRVTEDSRNYVLSKWSEPATIIELRNFDAVVEFADNTRSSSGLGLTVD